MVFGCGIHDTVSSEKSQLQPVRWGQELRFGARNRHVSDQLDEYT